MSDEELIHFASEFREGILDGRPSAWMCFEMTPDRFTIRYFKRLVPAALVCAVYALGYGIGWGMGWW